MPSAAYFRRQADICVRLSLIASDERVSNRLITMAREYMASSEALDQEKGTDPASADPASTDPVSMADRSASSDGDGPALDGPPDASGASADP